MATLSLLKRGKKTKKACLQNSIQGRIISFTNSTIYQEDNLGVPNSPPKTDGLQALLPKAS